MFDGEAAIDLKPTQNFEELMQHYLFDRDDGFYELEDIQNHFATPMTFNSGWRQFLAKFLALSTGDILEVGPGHGALYQELSTHHRYRNKNCDFWLCEKSSYQLEGLKKNLETKKTYSIAILFQKIL